jgi:CRISPR/Cas system CMR-associated protein Cmr3 (group 5 of RAMP superfamily)
MYLALSDFYELYEDSIDNFKNNVSSLTWKEKKVGYTLTRSEKNEMYDNAQEIDANLSSCQNNLAGNKNQ